MKTTTNGNPFGDWKHLPAWQRKLLSSCPTAGSGVHHWLFPTSLKLHPHFPDKSELARLLEEATAGCGREVTAREIEDAVTNSLKALDGTSGPRAPRWPLRRNCLIAEIANRGPGLLELAASSPVRWSDGAPHAEEIVDTLFPGNPLLCASWRTEKAVTRSREEWRGYLERMQFIVPSPMSSLTGTTQLGAKTMRSLSNTGPRKFLVVEFDTGNFDQHAAVLKHLDRFARLVLVVHSGNKSLHGWFYCSGESELVIENFFRFAVSLGADRATWTRCQWVRMPDGKRDNGRRQRVVFFNPERMGI